MTQLVHIVDDDVSFRRATGRLLRANGFTVEEHESADQFLERVRAGTEVGCVLLDVSLPGLSGPELQSRLHDVEFPFPIVFLTGHGDIPTTVRAIKSGAEDFMTKPARSEALLNSSGGRLHGTMSSGSGSNASGRHANCWRTSLHASARSSISSSRER